MEIKAELIYPYSEQERMDFIVEQNHQNGYEIRYSEREIEEEIEIIGENEETTTQTTTKTVTDIQAWGYTQQEIEEKEREKIGNLTCTKRVFILMLENLGFDYFEQIEPLINANRDAKLEWTLCNELLRSNPLIDTFAQKFELTSEQIDEIFIQANNL